MKRKLLFAILMIVSAFGFNLNAQTWTAPTIQGEDPTNGETYKVFNVDAAMSLDMGKAWFGWTTTAILSTTGIDFTLTADGDNWKFIRTGTQGVFTSGNGIAGDAMHVDNTANTYGVTKLANGYYHIHDAGGNATSLCWGYNPSFHATGVVAHADATAAGWMCEWVFLKDMTAISVYKARVALYNIYLKAFAEGVDTNDAESVYVDPSASVSDLEAAAVALNQARYEHKLAIASNDDPQDITEFVLTNADFSAGNINGWETNYVSGQQANNIGYQSNNTYTNGTAFLNQFIEAWRGGNAAIGNGYLRQTVSGLPEGKYTLEADAIAVNQGNPSATTTGALLYINAAGVDYKTSLSTGNGQPEHFMAEFLSPGGVDVTFGLKTESTTANWIAADNFVVKFYGIDLSPYAALLADAVAEAQALQGIVPTAAYNALDAVVVANNQTWTTSAEYTTAIAAIQEAIATATAMQVSYSRYNTIKTEVLAISSDVDVTGADTAVEAATTTEAIEAAIAMLRAALLDELPNVTIPTAPGYIDVTAAMVDNAGVRLNTDFWTIEGTPNGGYSFGVCNYNECEFYQQNFKFYQTLALARGTWEFGVTGFHRAGNHSTYFYAGEDQILIPGVGSDVVNTMAAAETYFNNGNGKVALKFVIESDQNVEIGINNQDTQTDKWTIFRDFTLKYYGEPDYSVYDQQWAALVAEADTAKADNVNVTGAELTALNAAIADEPDGSSKANYLEKIQALEAAIATFTAAAPSYDALAAAQAEANPNLAYASVEALDDLNAAKTAVATDAADAVVKTQAITTALRAYYESHALAEGVSAAVNMTNLIVNANDPTDLNGWTCSANVKKYDGQSWTDADGTNDHTYFDGGDWGGTTWTNTMSQDITLPAGRYLLTAKGRAAVFTTLTMAVGSETVEFPHIADVGGVFDKGWNDGSVEFTAYSPITILVTASTTDHEHEWFSICDFRLVQLEELAILGDMNGDGEITIGDLTQFVNLILDGQTPANGDVNGDGTVNAQDIAALANLIVNQVEE